MLNRLLCYYQKVEKLRNRAGAQPRVVGTRGGGRECYSKAIHKYSEVYSIGLRTILRILYM